MKDLLGYVLLSPVGECLKKYTPVEGPITVYDVAIDLLKTQRKKGVLITYKLEDGRVVEHKRMLTTVSIKVEEVE